MNDKRRKAWLLVGILGSAICVAIITLFALLAFAQIYFPCEAYMALGTATYVFVLIVWFHIPPNDDEKKEN